MNTQKFDAFVAKLDKHDWHYDFAENNTIWRRGKKAHDALLVDTRLFPEYKAAFDAYYNYKNTVGRSHEQNAANRAIRDAAIATIRKEL